MGWEIGFDDKWKRDIGYGVPAFCDHPDCAKEIDRGLGYVCCGQEPRGGEGCGLYFCQDHKSFYRIEFVAPEENAEAEDEVALSCCCERCRDGLEPFTPKLDHPEWIAHKATDPSWAEWRASQGEDVPGGAA